MKKIFNAITEAVYNRLLIILLAVVILAVGVISPKKITDLLD